MQQTIGVTYVTGEVKVEDDNGNEETEDDSATGFAIGLSLAFDTSPKNIFAITPRVNIVEEATSFDLRFAFIFSTN